ncbi:MAG: DUF4258 domain-containing protein [Terriglobales bacterium]
MDRFGRADAQRKLRSHLNDGGVIFGSHFRHELAAEALDLAAAFAVLKSGSILAEPELDVRRRDWKYRVEGYEPGGKWLVIVFCFSSDDASFLITTFSVQGRERK